MNQNLNYLIEQVGRDKGIDKRVIIEALEDAMLKASKKRYGLQKEIEARFNEEQGEVELFQFKTVVEKVEDPDLQIPVEEAKRMDPEAEVGDSLGVKLSVEDLGRIAAQTAKQVIMQRVRDAEGETIYNEYKDRKGEVVTGFVQRIERGNIYVNLGRTEAILPKREQVPREAYKRGERIKAYILDVQRTPVGCQIYLSRTHPGFLAKLFEIEVPEISEGIVRVMSAAREPGERSKIAVYSNDTDVDPVGASVGMKGSRVQSVVQELRGEKIDIIPYSSDPAKFVCNALSPAKVSKVYLNNEEKYMEIVVADDQLSLAIGKRGQNVRLASKLTGWKIDIKSESKMEKLSEEVVGRLTALPGVGEIIARVLYDEGFYTIEDVAESDGEELGRITGIGEKKGEKIVEAARVMAGLTTVSEEGKLERVKRGDDPVERLPGVGEKTAALLQESGYGSVRDLFQADVGVLSQLPGFSRKKAENLIQAAKEYIDKGE
ncbi:MAG: transcription termination/antitermination protein NusA [Deltaproteobacteria bacterium RBG_16_54_11]|jgi:N utilization substance protein A|nr:MAG: transcription termination/antitermination protein NusA [Deltaproteobacteria bacterium RBG_16_54_11]